jgi:hypothetical protein
MMDNERVVCADSVVFVVVVVVVVYHRILDKDHHLMYMIHYIRIHYILV